MVLSLPPYLRPVGASVVALAAAAGALFYGHTVERLQVRLREVDVYVPELPPAFDGYRIVQLSDFHIGGRGWSSQLMEQAAELASRQGADLVALTGDYVENTAGIDAWTASFGALHAPDGVVAVLGNHDYFDHGVRVHLVVSSLERCGFQVLRNQATSVERDGQRLWIVGVDDPYSGHDYLPGAMKGVPEHVRPLMLVHYPDFTWRLSPDRWALALCGHAHGSQVRLPFVARYLREHIAHTRFSHGLYRVNRIPVFVTTGVGTSGRPVRLFAPPEVALIRLRAGPV